MQRWFVDSNVFLRFFAGDDSGQTAEAEQFFLRAKRGEIALFCGPPVFFELAWVLRSVYRKENALIADILESILSLPHLTVLDADAVTQAVSLSRQKEISFADAYIAATAATMDVGVATFNRRHFQKTGRELYPFSV